MTINIFTTLFYVVATLNLIEIDCLGYKVQIPVEKEYKKHFDQYTEGFFYDFVFEDKSTISVHCGSNVKRPFYGSEDLGDSLQVNGVEIVRYKGKKNGKYFIEDFYIKPEITITARYTEADSHVVKAMAQVKIKKNKDISR